MLLVSLAFGIRTCISFAGAHRRPAEQGHEFSIHSGLQHVQGTVNVNDIRAISLTPCYAILHFKAILLCYKRTNRS